MREIKFRVFKKEDSLHLKRGMYDVDGIFFYPEHGGGEVFFKTNDEHSGKISDFLEDVELVQFTGLLDCKGKEIYEGDIVRYEGGVCVIEDRMDFSYSNDNYTWGWRVPFAGFEPIEVIGNVHENPELLE